MSVRFAVMGLLVDGPDHGYRLRRRFEEKVGEVWDLNSGQVYQTLRTLEKHNLVAPLDGETGESDESAVGRRQYELTQKGREALDRWLGRAPSLPHPIRDELLVRLLILEPDRRRDAIDRLAAQERVYKEHLSQLLARKRHLGDPVVQEDLIASFGLEAAVRHTMAHLGWLDDCKARLAKALEQSCAGSSDVETSPEDEESDGCN